jgi:hypothetical protein
VPNAVTVKLPTAGGAAGQIQIWLHGTSPQATVDVIVDIVGYYTPGAGRVRRRPGSRRTHRKAPPRTQPGPKDRRAARVPAAWCCSTHADFMTREMFLPWPLERVRPGKSRLAASAAFRFQASRASS